MAKILVHITHRPEHPTKAALGFLIHGTSLCGAVQSVGVQKI